MNIELLALLKYGWGGLAAYYWYDKKKQDAVLEAVTAKLSDTPTRDEMKKEISESVTTIKSDQKEMIIMTREMNATLNQLVRDLAVLNAKWSMTHENNNNTHK